MKLVIQKIEPKLKQKTVHYRIKPDQVLSIQNLENRLASEENFTGTLPWNLDLAEKINEEIRSRQTAPDNQFVDYKFFLPVELFSRMKQSDKDYAKKGYSYDWDSRIRTFLDLIIKNYTRQLDNIFGQPLPLELGECGTKSREDHSSLNTENPKINVGVSHETD